MDQIMMCAAKCSEIFEFIRSAVFTSNDVMNFRPTIAVASVTFGRMNEGASALIPQVDGMLLFRGERDAFDDAALGGGVRRFYSV